MTRQEILEFISENPVAFFATAEGSQPRVRAMMMVRADEEGLLFNTGKPKDVYEQLLKNPLLELCFYNPKKGEQVRVSGKAEFTQDPTVLDSVLEKFTFLKPVVEEQGYDVLASFFIRHARACHWDFKKNMDPKDWVEL